MHSSLTWRLRSHLSNCAYHTVFQPISISFSFFFTCSAAHQDLHSFPTRRSSDLARSPTTTSRPRGRLSTSSERAESRPRDRKSTRLNSSHGYISYAVFCLKKKKNI